MLASCTGFQATRAPSTRYVETTALIPMIERDVWPCCATQVVFHPKEPIIASCSSDKTVYMGEIHAV